VASGEKRVAAAIRANETGCAMVRTPVALLGEASYEISV
jgi:hypothetical protein